MLDEDGLGLMCEARSEIVETILHGAVFLIEIRFLNG